MINLLLKVIMLTETNYVLDKLQKYSKQAKQVIVYYINLFSFTSA